MISRRDFLKLGAASITGLWFLANSVQKLAVKAFSTSNALAKFGTVQK